MERSFRNFIHNKFPTTFEIKAEKMVTQSEFFTSLQYFVIVAKTKR